MSRHNKVNPDHYTLAGRLSPDDLARERRKQSESMMGRGRRRGQKATPPWMANDTNGEDDDQDVTDTTPSDTEDMFAGDDEDDTDFAGGQQAGVGAGGGADEAAQAK